MNIQRIASIGFVGSLGLAQLACAHAESVKIANPLVSGAVQQNEIKFPESRTEMEYQLPTGTLVHEASLVSLDDKEICFKLTLRSEGQRKDLAVPKNWRVFLRGKPSFEDMSPQFKDVSAIQEDSVAGSVSTSASENQRICDNNGNCYNRAITITSRVPQDIKVLTGGGTVCFANKGNINKTTEEVTLHLDDPNPSGGAGAGAMGMGAWGAASAQNRVAFRWKFN